jgi:hypothetical protein
MSATLHVLAADPGGGLFDSNASSLESNIIRRQIGKRKAALADFRGGEKTNRALKMIVSASENVISH